MTYLDKYPNCNGCPVEKYCGTAVGSVRLCQSYNDSEVQRSTHALAIFKTAPKAASEEEYIEEKITMWDNIKD